jgi:hypothetical protein
MSPYQTETRKNATQYFRFLQSFIEMKSYAMIAAESAEHA